MEYKKVRIGDLLLENNLINQMQLEKALSLQKNSGFSKKLGEIFIEEGFVSEKEFVQLLASQLNFKFIDLFGTDIDFNLLSSYSLNLFKTSNAIVFKEDSDFVYVAIADPLNYDAIELIEKSIVTKPIKLHIAPKTDIKHIYERYEIIETTKHLIENVKREIQTGEYQANDEQSSIMKLIIQMLKSAILNRSSDIHIEPNEYNVSIRNRIDGVLREVFVLDLEIYSALASRIKILGNLDISERRKSQDGRFSMKMGQKDYDFRLSTAPTLYGESIVMRILDQQKVLLKLNDLGIEGKNLKKFNGLLQAPYGIVFVTGPTGSGKTTSLYAALNEVKNIENKVITIEDPIEYQLPLVQQIPVNEKINYGFSDALRSILRQDPDIIMIGEVRDQETLHAAVQASLTGHLVFATLHTNDAPSAVTRMIQMGLEPYLIADSLVGVVAQRLVRKICTFCKTEHKPYISEVKKVDKYLPQNYTFYHGKGCSKCTFTGYSGRIMISEILKIDNQISNIISQNKNKYEISDYAQKVDYEPMLIDGLNKALQGITSFEEVLRVVKV